MVESLCYIDPPRLQTTLTRCPSRGFGRIGRAPHASPQTPTHFALLLWTLLFPTNIMKLFVAVPLVLGLLGSAAADRLEKRTDGPSNRLLERMVDSPEYTYNVTQCVGKSVQLYPRRAIASDAVPRVHQATRSRAQRRRHPDFSRTCHCRRIVRLLVRIVSEMVLGFAVSFHCLVLTLRGQSLISS